MTEGVGNDVLLLLDDLLLLGDERPVLGDPRFRVRGGTRLSLRRTMRSCVFRGVRQERRIEIGILEQDNRRHAEVRRDPVDIIEADAAPPAQNHRCPLPAVSDGPREGLLRGAALREAAADLPSEPVEGAV